MPSFEQMRDRLPLLYRPEPHDKITLLPLFLAAVGRVLDDLHDDSTIVLQSHWFRYADSAFYNRYVNRGRELKDLSPLNRAVPADAKWADDFPYLRDLPRLANLLALPPWLEPSQLRELVEVYRFRLKRIVELYTRGLGTVEAMRRMVEAQLPIDTDDATPLEERDQPFIVEEFAPLPASHTVKEIRTRGEPKGVLGPLMRWQLDNHGLRPAAPTIVIQAEKDAVRPMVELYQAGTQFVRIGIAYTGTLASGAAMRLRPIYRSWLGGGDGLKGAVSLPDSIQTANPTAPGPWETIEEPKGAVVDLVQTLDHFLWVAANNGDIGELWRSDGTDWSKAIEALPRLHCLALDGDSLLMGSEKGLARIALYPNEGDPFAAEAISALNGVPVYAILQSAAGQWWLGSEDGAGILAADESFTLSSLAGTPVYALHQDSGGNLFFGAELGLFQQLAVDGQWYYYRGLERSEDQKDWVLYDGTLPEEGDVGLPAVQAVLCSPDASVWLGTASGIARYRARLGRGLSYETMLEAYPDLGTEPVHVIRQDQRGLIWFGTDRGLFRFDGRDLWHYEGSAWRQLGRADRVYHDPVEPKVRDAWWFRRSTQEWHRFDEIEAVPLRTRKVDPVTALAWTDGVLGELGTWDGSEFEPKGEIPPAELKMRFKPAVDRVLPGGLPALPRLPVSESTWRYLQMEDPADDFPEGPAYSTEARFIVSPVDPDDPEVILHKEAPGRYNMEKYPPASLYNAAIYAYQPVVRLWVGWQGEQVLTVLVRLKKREAAEEIDPAIIERVWKGMQQVRPAGVQAMLAVEEQLVRP